MSQRSWITTAIVGVAIVIVGAVALLIAQPWAQSPGTDSSGSGDGDGPNASPSVPLVAENTHLLTDAGPDAVVVVEFLDFECPTCGQLYPIMEDLVAEHGDDVTFAIRYLPLPGHPNAVTAALAAEAAAQQGEFHAMYQQLFETQDEWAGSSESQAPLFRSFAEELGLDMEAYDAAVSSQATLDRIQEDFDAAVALELTGTPTVFVDGQQVRITEFGDLETAILAALES